MLLPSACSFILKKLVNYYLVESGTVHHYDFGEIVSDLQLVDTAKILIQGENIPAWQAQGPGQKEQVDSAMSDDDDGFMTML